MDLTDRARKWLKWHRVTSRDIERGVIDVEIDHEFGGFFAQLNWCLHILKFAELNSIGARIALTSRNYRVDTARRDWLPDFFDHKLDHSERIARSAAPLKRIRHLSELDLPPSPDLPLRQAHDVFFRNLAIREEFEVEAEDFFRRHFHGRRVLGVHYRGTDKRSEAPRVPYDRVAGVVRAHLEGGSGFDAVYLATDEAAFLAYLTDELRDLRVVTREDSARSATDVPVHLSRTTGRRSLIGRDALVNCMLLARCRKLVRTTSFLSAWASILNPGIDVELLNEPFGNALWYPEREILRVLRGGRPG